MQEPDAVAAQLGAAQALGLDFGRARDRRLRLLDQRADDIRLPALVEVPAQAPVGLPDRSAPTQAVTIGLRSAGGRVISVTFRSP